MRRLSECSRQLSWRRRAQLNSRSAAGTYRSTTRYRPTMVALLVMAAGFPDLAEADVSDITIADVTTRSFSVVWVSDEPVISASVRVFADVDGTTELTSTLTIDTVSAVLPPAHDQGIVKVVVDGLSAQQAVFVQTVTDTATGQVASPAAAPFLGLATAVATTRAQPNAEVIANDLIQHVVVNPLDGATPTAGTLVLLEVSSLGTSPLSAIVGESGFTDAVFNLNNYRDDAGTNIAVPDDEILSLTEFRGLLCTGLDRHRLVRFRRHPVQMGSPPITELRTPAGCFFADTVCDDEVNVLDLQFVLNAFNRTLGECGFHPDLDISVDNVINILDVQSVLNRFGQQAPFP